MRYIDWMLRRINILRNSNILDFPYEKQFAYKVNSLYTTGVAKVKRNMMSSPIKLALYEPKRK
jgi:hypothetical protein